MGKIEGYQSLPNGFPTVLNKMLKAVHVSRPLKAARFLAEYLEAEVNKRILCDLQLNQICPFGSVAPSEPWVQYMSFVTIQTSIDDLMKEEDPNHKSTFQWNDNTIEKSCLRTSSARRGKPFPRPPVAKAMNRCRLRYDRYGPIVKTMSISRRSIRRYMRDKMMMAEQEGEGYGEEGLEAEVGKCRRHRRPSADYWRQILRDCAVKAKMLNQKKEDDEENPRRRRRSESLTEMTSSGGEDEKRGGEGSVDPYLETKRRRKARNDEGLANIIYRELGTRRPKSAAGEVRHAPPYGDGKLPPGMENKAVQVELVRSLLPRPRSPPPVCPRPPPSTSPPPPPTPSATIDVIFHPVETFDKETQVDFEDFSTEDLPTLYPDADWVAAELDWNAPLTCPPPPKPIKDIDWTLFVLPPSPPHLWIDADIEWMAMVLEQKVEVCVPTDGPVRDVPANFAEQSRTDDALPEEVTQLVDLDFPAATTLADAPAAEFLLGEKDPPASSTLADAPAEPFEVDGDAPAHSPVADGPAGALLPWQESTSKLMEADEVDDPFDDYAPPS